MYIECLKKNQIPWRSRWNCNINRNGITNTEYNGVNQLLLSVVSSNRNYKDPRWFTFVQVQKNGYKLKNSKNKGVPIEFWSVYNLITKQKINFEEYQKIIDKNPKEKYNYRVISRTSCVFNAEHIEGLPELKENISFRKIPTSKYIASVIRNFGVRYSEHGNQAYYNFKSDEIVLPTKNKFVDEYSYYATQLHELCHSSGHANRLNRDLENTEQKHRAREELIAEISSSFLVQKLNIDATAEHYDNHQAYIQSWIKLLENDPNELFKAIKEADRVCEYIEQKCKIRKREYER